MYMRNKNNNYYDRYSKYNINDFPPNYSGQYTKESLREDDPETCETAEKIEKTEKVEKVEKIWTKEKHDNHEERREHKEKEGGESNEKHNNSFLGNLFGGHKNKDGKKGGLLSGFFNKGDKDKDGGFLSNIELEDLILIAVIFFLLKDGLEDDLILILAIILFAS